MARAHDRKQQLKKQKAKTKREEVRRKNGARALPTNPKALIARALGAPFGPCWVSTALDEPNEEGPVLITIVISRRVGGLLLPCIVLVDRTCLGVKNAFTVALQTELDLDRLLLQLAANGDPLRPADLLLAQSVIFHALDYARSLGFEPHRDFVAGLIGERPTELLETPLCRPERPLYISGPDDDVARIISRLDARVGRDGYDLVEGIDEADDDVDDWDLDDADLDDADLDDEGFDDDDVMTVEGIEAPPELRPGNPQPDAPNAPAQKRSAEADPGRIHLPAKQ